MTLVVACLCFSVAGIPGQFTNEGEADADPIAVSTDKWLDVMADVPESVSLATLIGEAKLDPLLKAVLDRKSVDATEFVNSSRKIMEGSRWSAPSPEAIEGLDSILSNLPQLADVEIPTVPESTTPRPDPRAEQEMLKRLDGRFNAPSEQGDR